MPGLERPRPHRSWRRIARRYFSVQEFQALDAMSEPEGLAAFFACWVRKEALVKATGGGIASGLAAFDVNVAPHEPGRLLSSRSAALEPGGWQILDFEPAPGLRACVAVEGQEPVRVHSRGVPWPD